MEKRKLTKNEIIILSIVNVIGVAGIVVLFVLSTNYLLPISMVLFLAVGDYLLISNPQRKEEEKQLELSSEFVRIFDYFSIYIKSGVPVYHALEETIQYASPEMAARLQTLLRAIDEDKSATPYIEFSKCLNTIESRQVLISIYKMSIEGGDESYINQFNFLFETILEEERKQELLRLEKRLNTTCYLPLAGSGLTMILIVVGIINVMGGLISGI
ncbi:MAG: hypothetical protein MJ238_02745 [Bacilli bacterium]|nr:hypothetical protein [Bacilli bacterium]